MRKAHPATLTVLTTFAVLFAILPLTGQEAKPEGKLILWSDVAMFQPGPRDEVCTTMNRFKRGENVGFRLHAIDGGTGEPQLSAQVVVHIEVSGKTYDLPAKYRGIPQKNETGGDMPLRPGMWTAKWKVPDDAPTGVLHYSATASDKYGRTAEWKPDGGQPSFLTVVQ